MPKPIDLTGKRFGRWRVVDYLGRKRWSCVCDCGTRRDVWGHLLRAGRSKSCGCFKRERATTHGMTGTREYIAWTNMKQRCLNPKHTRFEWYGGRGICVEEDWLAFEGYFADTGPTPEACSLDRIDVNGNYGPTNW